MLLEVITPESRIFSGEVSAIQFPGLDGSFQVLENHAPIISSLRAGNVKIDLKESLSSDEKEELHKTVQVNEGNPLKLSVLINGGVVEMNDNRVIVLAE